MEQSFDAKVLKTGAKMVGIQSNVGKSPAAYRHLLQRAWAGKASVRASDVGAEKLAVAAT
jgi:hypothetical protein